MDLSETVKQVWDAVNGNLGAATIVLAIATVALAWEARQSRLETGRERRRAAFRAALVEALDNCRWRVDDPARGMEGARRVKAHQPSFEAAGRLLAEVNLPAQLLMRLVWLIDIAQEQVAKVMARAEVEVPGLRAFHSEQAGTEVKSRQEDLAVLRTEWTIAVDHLQTLLCLIRCEARRQGFADVADAFVGHDWLKPDPLLWNRMAYEKDHRDQRGAPIFPTDQAYAECAPGAREAAANEVRPGNVGPMPDPRHGLPRDFQAKGAVTPPD